MVNPFKEVNWNPGLQERRKFALSLVIGFPCVALLLLVVGYLAKGNWNVPLALRVGGIGAGAGLLFFAVPAVSKPFYVLWYALACCIGIVVGNVLLSLVFYGLFTPVGLGMRILGRRGIVKTVNKDAQTYWQEAKQPDDPQRYYRQF